uniref:P2X purinoreceptor 7 intracellular domain-containing protein n=1 Tax=Nothobranchius rachovii TaxID=451742 RepID=A0A1A8QE67_9TELE
MVHMWKLQRHAHSADEGNLRIHRQYREDLMAVRPAREPGDDNREYRYAAYRHFIFWQHGAFGRGNQLVIPSCCVWVVRDRYQDPYGQYKGFVPGR